MDRAKLLLSDLFELFKKHGPSAFKELSAPENRQFLADEVVVLLQPFADVKLPHRRTASGRKKRKLTPEFDARRTISLSPAARELLHFLEANLSRISMRTLNQMLAQLGSPPMLKASKVTVVHRIAAALETHSDEETAKLLHLAQAPILEKKNTLDAWANIIMKPPRK